MRKTLKIRAICVARRGARSPIGKQLARSRETGRKTTYHHVENGVEMGLKSPFFMPLQKCEKMRKMSMGLHLGLQMGLQFNKNTPFRRGGLMGVNTP